VYRFIGLHHYNSQISIEAAIDSLVIPDAQVSKDVCRIELSRQSPILKLKDKEINEQMPMEFPYQPASASSNSKVLSLVEFTLLNLK
jgi:hypothetical protein